MTDAPKFSAVLAGRARTTAAAHYARLAMRLHDTATGEVRELAQREPGTVSIYLCGPTVYGPPHLGHGRATRRLRHPAPLPRVDAASSVRLVSNVTDIDDKIIERANREGRDPAEIAPAVRGGVVARPWTACDVAAPDRRAPRHRLGRRRWSR